LGDWNITVSVLDQSFHKSFQVAEYVLPKFEVGITTPPYTTFKDSRVSATITAKFVDFFGYLLVILMLISPDILMANQ
jgi:CD109 antigen